MVHHRLEISTADDSSDEADENEILIPRFYESRVIENLMDYSPPVKEDDELLPKLICFAIALTITAGIIYSFSYLVQSLNINLFGGSQESAIT